LEHNDFLAKVVARKSIETSVSGTVADSVLSLYFIEAVYCLQKPE
jgi:hypothetical protein